MNKPEKHNLKFTCEVFGTGSIGAIDFATAQKKLEYAIKKEIKNRYIYRANIEFLIKNHKNLKIEEVKNESRK